MSNEPSDSLRTLHIAHCTLHIAHWHENYGKFMGSVSGFSPRVRTMNRLDLSLVTGNWKLKNMVTFGKSICKSPVTSDKLPVTSRFTEKLNTPPKSHTHRRSAASACSVGEFPRPRPPLWAQRHSRNRLVAPVSW